MKKTFATTCMVVLLAMTVAACGSSSDHGGGGGESSSASSDTAAATKAVSEHEGTLEFSPPGPPIDASKAAGKTIFNIPSSSSNEFLNAIDEGGQKAAEDRGVKWVQYQNQGNTTEWIQGIQQAISQNADVLILNAIDPSVVAPQLKQAQAAGVKIVSEHLYDPEATLPKNVDAFSFAPFNQAARTLADWTIADSEGSANALLVTSNDFPPSKPQRDAMREEFEKECPGCSTRVIDVPSSGWATDLQGAVQSELTKDPKTDYVLPLYDSMAQFVVPGVTAAGRTGQTQVASYNGTPAIMKMIEDGDVMAMDVGEDPLVLAYAGLDQSFRLLLGDPPAKDEITGFRVFTDGNIDEAGTPPELGKGYGDAVQKGYEQLWSGK